MYGREALRRLRAQQEEAQKTPKGEPSFLAQIPGDAPMDDATLTVWNGERWVAWEKWLATAPLKTDEPEASKREQEKGAIADEAADLPPQSTAVQEGLW